MTKINNITVLVSNTSCYKTVENLVCEGCHKKVESVVVFNVKNTNIYKNIGFTCGCFNREFEKIFVEYPDEEYINTCMIFDIDFDHKKTTKKKVRNEMTTKLRFEILKRDNFKCVLCGREPPEVKLVVDHINPVCNGGKSIKENLRTLCFECNSGKGGSYD